MNRHYFISDDLEDLKATENDFYACGFFPPQLHVLSERDSELVKYHLHEVDSFSKSDVVHGGLIGAAIGVVIGGLIATAGVLSGAGDFAGWVPFVFLSVATFCFCTWEGGLYGIQVKNVEFRRFENVLKQGKHVLIVDAPEKQFDDLETVVQRHPKLALAGTGSPRPFWLVHGHKRFNHIVQTLP